MHSFWCMDMPDVTVCYGTTLDLVVFERFYIYNLRWFMSDVLYLHQTFTDYVYD